MIIQSVEVNNFRVYSGSHSIELSPTSKHTPIILFGGMNGHGKTTLLTSVRLALYGKLSQGALTSDKAYHDQLSKMIHRGKGSILGANTASVSIKFSYSKLGETFDYVVTREWMRSGKSIRESLKIIENGQKLSSLTNEQAQGFLNELIPIGVSDLFFFDGEKIKSLAEEKDNKSLGAAIKSLIGIDQIETLRNDLGIYINRKNKELSKVDYQERITTLTDELEALGDEESIGTVLNKSWSDFNNELIKFNEKKTAIEIAERHLMERGGAWSKSYEEQKSIQSELLSQKAVLEAKARELVAGHFPISVAEEAVMKLSEKLDLSKKSNSQSATLDFIENHQKSIKEYLDSTTSSHIDIETLVSAIKSSFTEQIVDGIDISNSDYYQLKSVIDMAKVSASSLEEVLDDLSKINDQLDELGLNLSRAPTEEQITVQLSEIAKLNSELSDIKADYLRSVDVHKEKLQRKLNVLRELNDLTGKGADSDKVNRSVDFAVETRALLKRFIEQISTEKIKEIEEAFSVSFEKFARKDDIHIRAKIDPKTFGVTIIRDDDHTVDKNELSAGEQQIYAIAMLDALAKCSGKHLPIIIDTPLGRLDSEHREKLIQHYFPHASHQVIILSTDEEIDDAIHQSLEDSISRTYLLEYDSNTASSKVVESYFNQTGSLAIH